FQAEDGIRDRNVTGVQTCALPILQLVLRVRLNVMSTIESTPSENLDFDQRVGRNIMKFRGDKSQQALAERMRDKGFKWSQATVWATEKGDRPIRLSEVIVLSEI